MLKIFYDQRKYNSKTSNNKLIMKLKSTTM